ncbi:MAG: VOC family protein [Caulobacteraceae bacterium]
MTDAISLCGTHHVRLPVADLERSFAFYGGLLGYQRDFDFKAEGKVIAYALKHPAGGTPLVLALDPARAAAAAGLQGLAFGAPDEATLQRLMALFDANGVRHAGIQGALAGSKLPFVEDPDGHLIGFYMTGARERQPG